MINLKKIKLYKYWMLLGILLLFTALNVYQLDLRVVMDENWNSVPGYTLATQGRLAIPPFKDSTEGYDQVYLVPPLQFIMLAGVYKVLGLGIIQGRLLSVFFGLLTVLLTFLVAQELFDVRIALFSSACIAADNFIFLTARSVRPEIFVAAFLLGAFFCYLRSLKDPAWSLSVGAGILLGLGILSHQNAAFGLIAFVILFSLEYGPAFLLKRSFWLFVLGLAAVVTPFLFYLFLSVYPDKIRFLPAQYLFSARLFPLFSLKWIFHSLQGELFKRIYDFMIFPLRLHIVLFSILGIIYAFCRRNKADKALLTMVLTFIVLFILVVVNKNVRYLVDFLPFVTIITVSAIFGIFDKTSGLFWKKIMPYSIVGVLIVSQLFGNIAFFIKYADSGYNNFMREINNIIPRKASVYGPITYWLGLYKHDYYAYNRIPFSKARGKFPIDVFLVEKMVAPSYVNNVRGMKEYVIRYGRLLGEVKNDFYGEVKIYQRSK